MANEKNLVPFDERTESEQREIASAGGKASGKARRRKKNLKQKMQLLLSLPAADNDQAELSAMGVDPEDMDNEMVLVKALFLAAAEGDTKAFDRIQDVLGKSVAREELALKRQEAKRRAASGEDTQAMKKAVELLGGIQSVIDQKTD
ncbi:MAG TPA: stress-induced protein [Candidatus Gallacutalibacter pullistercoris]|nr:stress-induced protein [Candidatus Gallacutalibacter pullistercoris]